MKLIDLVKQAILFLY